MNKPRQMNIDDLEKKEKTYSILELNVAVRVAIKKSFSQYIWVCGEIQDMRASRGRGHIYFNCVEKDADLDTIIAQVSAALFAGRVPKIFNKLKEADPDFKLKDGIEVKLLCEVDLYPKTGNFSLIVVDIDPIYTLGKIAQNRQKIIEELKSKGLLDKNKFKEIPQIPLRIGLITAYDSAAYHDFTNELVLSGYGFKVLAYNCHMQGNLVEPDLLAALRFFNNLKGSELDLVIITRGGGSTADLSYFDNRKIAEAVAEARIPVISAIGHHINTTIVDMVAHTFYKTPTKAGQFLVERIGEFLDNLRNCQDKIFKISQDLIVNRKNELQILAQKIESLTSRYFRVHNVNLLEKKHKILHSVRITLEHRKQALKSNFDVIRISLDKLLKYLHSNIKYTESKIKILDPRNILKRGYSITYKGNKAVKSIEQISAKDQIISLFYDGKIISEVKKKTSDSKKTARCLDYID